MPRFAHFDPVSLLVLGWLDTDQWDYPSLPDETVLLALSDEQWEAQQAPAWVHDGSVVLEEPEHLVRARAWAIHQAQAIAALQASDVVALRCLKAGISFPSAWMDYVDALREIVRTPTGEPGPLPARPDYPPGT